MTWVLLALIGVLSLILGFQFLALLRARRARGKKVVGLGQGLGRSVASGGKVLAYFWSPSCGSCRRQDQVMDRLQKEFSNIVKVNIAEDMASARALGVMGTPSLVLIIDGHVQEMLVGLQSEKKLRALLST